MSIGACDHAVREALHHLDADDLIAEDELGWAEIIWGAESGGLEIGNGEFLTTIKLAKTTAVGDTTMSNW